MAKKRNELYYQLPRGVGLEELTDEEAGQVWKALDRYNGERETMPKATMRLIYRQCCDHIDTENERYDAYCEKQKEISRRRQSWKEKHQADVEKTSNDIEGYPTTSYNHNHNTESESKTESESNQNHTTYGGGNNRAATAAEASEIQDRFFDSIINSHERLKLCSEAVGGMDEADIMSEIVKFKATLACNGDLTIDERELGKSLTAWLRAGKNKQYCNSNKNGADKKYNIAKQIADDAARVFADGAERSLQTEDPISDIIPF